MPLGLNEPGDADLDEVPRIDDALFENRANGSSIVGTMLAGLKVHVGIELNQPEPLVPPARLECPQQRWASECSPPIVIGKKSRLRVSTAVAVVSMARMRLRHVEQRDLDVAEVTDAQIGQIHVIVDAVGREERPDHPQRVGSQVRRDVFDRLARDRHHQQADVERLLAIPGPNPVRYPRLVGILPGRSPHQLRRPQIGSPVTVTCSFLHRARCRHDGEPAALLGNRDPFAAAFQRFARGEGDGQRLECVGRSGAVGGVAAANDLQEVIAFG